MSENLLTAGQAAEILNIHRETLRRYESGGLINAQKTKGGHRRYSEDDILEFKSRLAAGLKESSKNLPSASQSTQQIDAEMLREYSRMIDVNSKLLENMDAKTAANILSDFLGFEINVKQITVKEQPGQSPARKRWEYDLADNQNGFEFGKLSVNFKGEIFFRAQTLGQLDLEHQLQTIQELESAIINLAERKVSKLIRLFRLGIFAGLSLIVADLWFMIATHADGAQWIATATLSFLIVMVLWGMKLCLASFHQGLAFQKALENRYTIKKTAIFNDKKQPFSVFIRN